MNEHASERENEQTKCRRRRHREERAILIFGYEGMPAGWITGTQSSPAISTATEVPTTRAISVPMPLVGPGGMGGVATSLAASLYALFLSSP